MSTILITLHDVEPAVRLNARLEGDGHTTALVSPLDDIRAEIRRAKPDLIVITGELHRRGQRRRCCASSSGPAFPSSGSPTATIPRSASVSARSASSTSSPSRSSSTTSPTQLRAPAGAPRAPGGHGADRRERAAARGDGQGRADGARVEHGAHRGRERHGQGARRARASRRSALGATSRSSPSTSARCRRRCSRASCSATRRAPSPARRSAGSAGSSWRTAAPSSSTRSARSRTSTQVKLLRVLEEREFTRVGGTHVDPGRRARHRRDQPSAARARRGGEVPRRPVLPAQRPEHLPAAAARAAERHPAPRAPVHPRPLGPARPALPGHLGGRDASCSSSIPGRATCASCGTSSRAWSCCRTGARSAPKISRGRSGRAGTRVSSRCTPGPWCRGASGPTAGSSSSSSAACSSSSSRWRICGGGSTTAPTHRRRGARSSGRCPRPARYVDAGRPVVTRDRAS